LIDVVLDYAGRRRLTDQPLKILDVGTGTGCLLLTLLSEMPEATGLGTDISGDALETARGNAERLGLTDRVAWKQTRGMDGIEGPFDILISNPPYIPSGEIAGLAAEVRLHDPLAALDGGADGLEVYRQIAGRLAVAVPNGLVVLEVADGDHQRVIDVIKTGMAADEIEVAGCFEDLAGLVRCVALKTLCSG
jgi:release factor glutamine methyltransferase